MAIKRIDTARTTSLPVMDAADAIAMWGNQEARSDQPHASDPARIRAKHQTRSGTEPEKG